MRCRASSPSDGACGAAACALPVWLAGCAHPRGLPAYAAGRANGRLALLDRLGELVEEEAQRRRTFFPKALAPGRLGLCAKTVSAKKWLTNDG